MYMMLLSSERYPFGMLERIQMQRPEVLTESPSPELRTFFLFLIKRGSRKGSRDGRLNEAWIYFLWV